MGKILETLINDFSGGIAIDRRTKDRRKYSLTKHFDAYTYPHKLVPHFKTEASLGLSGAPVTDLGLTKFLYAQNQSETLFRLYALGSASGKVKLYRLDIDGSSNLDAENWVACTNGESGSGTRSENVFFYYKSFIFTISGTNLNKFDTLEIAPFADGYKSLAATANAVQPVHHHSDDCAYFFSDNIVYRLNDASWDGAVLTLPTDQQIVDAWQDGDYLKIACVTKGNLNVKSIVYSWDRDSSLTTLSQRCDAGEGKILYGANLGGNNIIVQDFYTNNSLGKGEWKLLIKRIDGTQAVLLSELIIDTASAAQKRTKFNTDQILYFPAKAQFNGDTRLGIWAVDGSGRIWLDTVEEQATSYDGIYRTANIWWIAHSADGHVTRSDDDGSYSATLPSVYESLIFDDGDLAITKKLVGVSVFFEPLPAGASVVLKYRQDGATDWTTIFTEAGDGEISHDSVNVESDNSPLAEYNENEFRIESYGGAAITGLYYKAETKDQAPY